MAYYRNGRRVQPPMGDVGLRICLTIMGVILLSTGEKGVGPGIVCLFIAWWSVALGAILYLCKALSKKKEKKVRDDNKPDGKNVEKKETDAPPVDPEATVPSRGHRNAAPESILIYVSGGSMDGSCFRCRKGAPVLMGRDPARCNLVMNGYAAISGLHCRLELDGSGVSVTDLGSTNGTWVNGIRLTPEQSVVLADGAEFCLANDGCVFRIQFE